MSNLSLSDSYSNTTKNLKEGSDSRKKFGAENTGENSIMAEKTCEAKSKSH